MKVILGLGNPGPEYDATRHNVGWWLLDALARRWHFGPFTRDGESLSVTGLVGTQKVKLQKPQTYMNLSGSVLRPYLKREGWVAANDLLVVVDDVAIPVGEYRLRASGSPGGHNGLKSVEAHLKSQAYPRLRMGIKPVDERRQIGDLADFVLRTMPLDERDLMESQFGRMGDAIERWITDGTEKAVSTMGR